MQFKRRPDFFLISVYHHEPGARFSKDPVTYGPDKLSGRLSGNFSGPGVAFLEAPVNFPGTSRVPGKIKGRYQALARATRSPAEDLGRNVGS